MITVSFNIKDIGALQYIILRMRIGFFADMYLPHISGITNHIRLNKRFFEQQGHEVFLITFGSTQYDDDEPNVVRNLAVPVGSTGWSYGPAFNKETRDLLPTLDIVHAHHPFQTGSYLLNHMKKIDAPLVFTNHTRHDLYADTYARAIPYTLRHKWNSRYLKHFTSQCDLVIAPSAGIVDWLAEYAQCHTAQVIPNGIDLSAFQVDGSEGKNRVHLGISKEDTLFCYVGRVSHEKNISYLLNEFLSLHRLYAQAKLMIVGDGTEMSFARDFIKRHRLEDAFILTGPKDYELIPEYVALADAFITGSVSEVHPLVVIEALAAGLPAIVVDSPGISDTVEHGKSGLLADCLEPGKLAYEAERLIKDKVLRAKLSVGARERSLLYCINNTAGQLLDAYEKLLEAS